MKKVILAFSLVLLANLFVQAQLRPLSPPQKKKSEIKTQTSPGLEAEPTRAQPVVSNTSYSLSSVKINIGTGSDNKESLSNVSIELAVRNTNFTVFVQNNLTNEMKTNSTTPIRLEKNNLYTSGYHPNAIPTIYYTSTTGTETIMLSDVEKYGLSLRIIYKPNFFADAWKIETISANLEFRDANGNLHSSSGQKTITFSNTATFLDNYDKRILICTADNYFNPVTSFVTKDFSKRW